MLDTPGSPRKGESRDMISDEEEPRSYVFVLSTIENKDKPEAAKRCGSSYNKGCETVLIVEVLYLMRLAFESVAAI